MASVTQRIAAVKQPHGGYLSPKEMTKIQLENIAELAERENVHASLVGLAVDYLTRFMLNGNANEAFMISILGAEKIGQELKCRGLLKSIKGLDDESIATAVKVVGYDVCFRASTLGYVPIETINADKATTNNIRIMVERSLAFFKKYGPITHDGFTFEGGYTRIVDTGDGDFLTKDTLWDFKVSVSDPTNKHTLQLIMYYLMGRHSIHPYFKDIKNIGIFNPRLNRVYLYDMSKMPEDVLEEIEITIIGY